MAPISLTNMLTLWIIGVAVTGFALFALAEVFAPSPCFRPMPICIAARGNVRFSEYVRIADSWIEKNFLLTGKHLFGGQWRDHIVQFNGPHHTGNLQESQCGREIKGWFFPPNIKYEALTRTQTWPRFVGFGSSSSWRWGRWVGVSFAIICPEVDPQILVQRKIMGDRGAVVGESDCNVGYKLFTPHDLRPEVFKDQPSGLNCFINLQLPFRGGRLLRSSIGGLLGSLHAFFCQLVILGGKLHASEGCSGGNLGSVCASVSSSRGSYINQQSSAHKLALLSHSAILSSHSTELQESKDGQPSSEPDDPTIRRFIVLTSASAICPLTAWYGIGLCLHRRRRRRIIGFVLVSLSVVGFAAADLWFFSLSLSQ